MQAPGGPIKEAGLIILFTLSAGNLFVYTAKAFQATYTRPPLATWQRGAGEKPSGPQGEGGGGGEGFPGESLLKSLGENLIP